SAVSRRSIGYRRASCRDEKSTAAITGSPSGASSREVRRGRRRGVASWSEPEACSWSSSGLLRAGAGVRTPFPRVLSMPLEIPIDRIRGVFHGSTAYVSDGYGSYHSRAVVMGGSAILLAASALREAISTRAAHRLGCEPAAVEIVEGSKAVGPCGSSLSLVGL